MTYLVYLIFHMSKANKVEWFLEMAHIGQRW